jgi:aspartyl-tRNA(Asn)/glutamyl-tRNA(Gln) amidotransferase subunit A
MISLSKLTIKSAHEAMKNGEFSARELAEEYLKVIQEKNPSINAYIEVYDDVLKQADMADDRFKNGRATLLTGIPIALKDNMLFSGKKVSSSSHILDGYVATYDGTVVSILKKEGAVLIGRTNMDEFAMGSSTETSNYGVTKNPFDQERVPGGSSGGSAAALAMDGSLVSLGSDTGGSIRQPAAFCGLVGLHPTYGSVSRYGLIAMGSSLDQIGPLTKTVEDAEIIFNAISKYDKNDSTSIPEEKRIKTQKSLKKKIGIPQSFLSGEGIDPEVLANFSQVVEKLKGSGYEIVDVSLPYTPYSLAVYYILMPAEASTNLSRFDGIRFGLREDGKDLFEEYAKTRGSGFGKEVRRRILLGTYVLSHGYYDAYYNKAILVRKEIEKELNKILEEVDVILTPSTPTPAFKIGEKSKDPVSMYLSDIFTVPANIAKVPAISIPSGKTRDGLPLGIQFIGPRFGEDILFKIGKDFESLV